MSDTPRTDAIEKNFGEMPGEMRKLERELSAAGDQLCDISNERNRYEYELTAAHQRIAELEKDKARLIDHFIDRAECAADNMEGEGGDEFTRYETRMVCAVETLEVLGVKYDPITVRRQTIDATMTKEPTK